MEWIFLHSTPLCGLILQSHHSSVWQEAGKEAERGCNVNSGYPPKTPALREHSRMSKAFWRELERQDVCLPGHQTALSWPSFELEGGPGQVTTLTGSSYSEAAGRTGSPHVVTERGMRSSGCIPWLWASRHSTRSQHWRGIWENPGHRPPGLWMPPWARALAKFAGLGFKVT